jgi:hypothetical protein
MRHSGSKNDAKFAQEIALEIARLYSCDVADVLPVDQIDVDSKSAD